MTDSQSSIMQLTTRPNYDQGKGELMPLEEMVVCSRLQEDDPETTPSSHSPPPSSTSPPLQNIPLHLLAAIRFPKSFNHNTTNAITPALPDASQNCTCTDESSIPVVTKKRKSESEESDVEEVEGERRVNKCGQEIQKQQKMLTGRRKMAHTVGQSRKNMPLFYLYGDYLLIPKYNWSSGGSGGRTRRRSPHQPDLRDLSTPIDSSNTLEASQLRQSKTSNLYHVRDGADSQSLEEGGFSQEWFTGVLAPLISHLNQYGVCVVDDFLGEERADQILNEVRALESHGAFEAGQVVSRQVQDEARDMIRGDKIAWVTGGEPNCSGIGQLVTVVDSLVAKANKHQGAGMLGHYNITWRTRAMVACYPGGDTRYVKHVDNPNGDGRCITAIYYLNRGWAQEDGGVLRIYPEGCSDKIGDIEPLFDRMLFFWSDRRNPHEVLPAKITSRYAITVWYLDQKEREEFLARQMHHQPTHT